MDTGKVKRVALLIGGVVGLLVLIGVGRGLLETNNAGYFQIRQAVGTGTLSVINSPGTYLKLFATVTTYQVSDMHYFAATDQEGDREIESDPIKVRFNDGGTAEVSGSIKYRLPNDENKQMLIHRDYKNYNAVKHDLIRQVVAEAVMQTANLMKAEESYTTRRSEFAALAEEQVKQGLFETLSKEYKEKDADGNEFIEREVTIKLDATGRPVVRKTSPFHQYGIEVIQFTIKSIDYDATIDALIAKKKEAEQQKVVARANAEKAKQDAITAREQGNARIAEEKATQEVEKIKQVTIAQKEYEVAKLRRQQAEQDAAAAVTKGKADAEVNRLKVAAGLTPLERANIEKETAIGVAEQLSKVQFPSMMVLGGGDGKGSATNPFDAVGLESFMRISEKLGNQHSSGKNK